MNKFWILSLFYFAFCPYLALSQNEFIESLTNGATTIDDLINRVPNEMRRNQMYMNESRALHREAVSHENPRSILFNNDASALLTFNSDPNSPTYNQVEALVFDPITLKPNVYLISFKNGKPIVKPNPRECMGCH
ncbi:hypothetical protein N9N67_12520, partial [Bacteriovoracaceae bacterium]|nr:hypothetical protein [Bacteriovoracaceae bacterium]